MKTFLKTPIHMLLHGRDVPRKGDVGVEIEAEFLNIEDIGAGPRNYWTTKDDASLRNNGIEYVLRGPLDIDVFNKGAIDEWRNYAAERNFHDTARTSLHVHLNCSSYTGLDVFTFLTVAWFLEDFLVAFCQPMREGNVFCLRVRDAEYPIISIISDMRFQRQQPDAFFKDATRYSAINGKALKDFGSIEFRCMRGLYDPDGIKYWVNLLHQMKGKALTFKSPKEITDLYIQKSKKDFISTFVDEYFIDYITSLPEWENILEEKFLLLNAFANETEFVLSQPDVKHPAFINWAAVDAPVFNAPLNPAPAPRGRNNPLINPRNHQQNIKIQNEDQVFEADALDLVQEFQPNPPGDH